MKIVKLDSPSTRLALQGDLVIISSDGVESVRTIVHYIDGDSHQLELVNKSNRSDTAIVLTQGMLDELKLIQRPAAKPATASSYPKPRDLAKWELKL